MSTLHSPAKVAIIGAGPAGLIMAILLRSKGVAATVFERAAGIAALPQAHVVNTRTCEILRELGLFEAMAAAASPEDKMLCTTWSAELSGTRFGHLLIEGNPEQKAARRGASPVRTLNMGQNLFCQILLEHLRSLGGEVLFQHQISAARVAGNAAELTIEDATGQSRVASFDYALACDGAASTVRKALGIDMLGPPSLARFATCYFKGDLNRYLGAQTGPVHFVAGQDVPGIFVSYDLDQTWALMCVMPPDTPRDAFSGDAMIELAKRAIGDPAAALELVSVSSWNMSAQLATAFRQGPFFLVGDAAHRFPPTGGLGLNTGVQDAHNLAWKLAMVLHGQAEAGLLDTYESERAAVAARNCAHSVENFQKLMGVQQAIGAEFLAPVDVGVVQRAAAPRRDFQLDGDAPEARRKREAIQAAIAEQRPHWDAVNLELGFVYGAAPAAGHGPGYDHVPPVQAGARLPHQWLDGAASRRSTLDLYGKTGYTMLLCEAPDMAGPAREALARAGIAVAPLACGTEQEAGRTGLRPGVAVLVRPDGHVLWHGRADAADFPQAALAALQQFSQARVSRGAAGAEFLKMMEMAMQAETNCPVPPAADAVPAGIRPKKLAHVVLRSDARYEAVCDWYRDMLSAQIAYRDDMTCFMTFDEEHHRVAVVRVPGMVERPSGVVGLEHVAFTFASLSDLLETYARLKPKGVVPILSINHGPTISLYYEDPDRNRVELQVDNQETIEEFLEYVRAGAMKTNPIGQAIDADAMLAKLRAGVPEAELKRYPMPPSPVDPAVMEILYRN